MFAVHNIMKIFTLIEELEEEHYRFTQEEKQFFYRGALYKDAFEEVREMIVRTAILEIGSAQRQELMKKYADSLPKLPDNNAEQIESYIFELQRMCYEREKAVRWLEDILQKHGISKETGNMAIQPGQRPAGKRERDMKEKSR